MSSVGHVFGYQVTDRPGVWLRVIAPGVDIQTLRAQLAAQFPGRLVAVRNEADPAAVIATAGGGGRSTPGTAPVRERPRGRHRWDRLDVHHYRCRLCQVERRNWIDPDTWQWFSTYAAPGQPPRRSTHTPPCAAGVRADDA